MVLNWNIEVILDFIFSFTLIITSIISYTSPKTKKIASLFYLRLGFFFVSLFMFFDGLAILFISGLFSRISGIMLLPLVIFVAIGVNYTFRDHFYSVWLIIVCSLGSLLVYFGIQPDAVWASGELGFPRMEWRGLFNVMGMLFSALASLYLLYWGTKTFINAPFLIKKDAALLFSGIIIASVLGMLFYVLYLIETYFILISNLMMINDELSSPAKG